VNFISIPLIDFNDIRTPITKYCFLAALRVELRERLIKATGVFFDLLIAKKLEVDVANSKHFRGYARSGTEKTATKAISEKYLLCLPKVTIPGLRLAIEAYLKETQALVNEFILLITEILAPPIPNTLVVNISQLLETLIQALEVTRENILLELPSRLMGLRKKDIKSEAEIFFVEVFKGSAS
ncbi:uncharacterized protein N7458_006576, partial [Penicillium daleae]